MVSFATDLWDCLEKVNVRVETQITCMKDYYSYLLKRIRSEEEMAKKILEITKQPPGNGRNPAVQAVEETFKVVLLGLVETDRRLAQKHMEVAKKLTEDVLKPLEASIKTWEATKKKNWVEGEKKLKLLREATATCGKQRDGYEKLSKELEVADAALQKAVADAKGDPENKRLQQLQTKAEQNKKKISDRVDAYKAAYQKAVDTVNAQQGTFYNDDMPRILGEFQKILEDSARAMQGYLSLHAEEHVGLSPEYADACEALKKRLDDEFDLEADLCSFVEATKTGAAAPEPARFYEYGKPEGDPAVTPSDAPASAPSETAKEGGADADADNKKPAGTEEEKPVNDTPTDDATTPKDE